jgi:AcrR family transcriptional regulator
MAEPDVDLRSALLAAAEKQLVAAPDGDIATRAVCEAAGVTQPVLYRIFGDKRGLLDALADSGLERYAARKAELEVSTDPAADLRAGWDDHLAFADEHAALYRLMFAPRPWASSRARDGISALLRKTLSRCAAAGLLRVEIDVASAMLLGANVGFALNRMADPGLRDVAGASESLRDAVLSSVLDDEMPERQGDPGAAARRQIREQLRLDPPEALLAEETALLGVWLSRLD